MIDAEQVETCDRNDALSLQFTFAGFRTQRITLKFCADRLFAGEFVPEASDGAVKKIAEALIGKYGPPEETGNEPKQNRFGANFTRKYWIWAFGAKTVAQGTLYDAVVSLENMSDTQLMPSLSIISPETMANCVSAGRAQFHTTPAGDDL